MRFIAIVTASLVLASCASSGAGSSMMRNTWTPTVDMRGVDQERYARDLSACIDLAKSDPRTDGEAAGKKGAMQWGLGGLAVVGAATVLTGGAALAALPAMAAPTALYAGGAAATGGLANKAAADARYQSMVSQCLHGRGYNVVG